MFTNEIKQIKVLLDKYNSFLITSTADADGDSIGAQLALYNILTSELSTVKGKTVQIVNESPCPHRYSFLPDCEKITTKEEVGQKSFDVGFVLDGGSERTGKIEDLFDRCQVKVLIDHHKFGSNKHYDIKVWDHTISSTTEIVYNFLESDAFHAVLTPAIASQIYLGIIFDTGLFRHSNTSPRTHRIAAELVKTGIDFPDIVYKGMLQKDFESQKLLALVLTQAKKSANGKVAWSIVTHAMMDETGSSKEHQEGLIEALSFIEGVEVSIIFKEHKDSGYKISFRSKNSFDVGQLARDLDEGGGGHEKAAGCLLKGEKEKIIHLVLKKIEETIR